MLLPLQEEALQTAREEVESHARETRTQAFPVQAQSLSVRPSEGHFANRLFRRPYRGEEEPLLPKRMAGSGQGVAEPAVAPERSKALPIRRRFEPERSAAGLKARFEPRLSASAPERSSQSSGPQFAEAGSRPDWELAPSDPPDGSQSLKG